MKKLIIISLSLIFLSQNVFALAPVNLPESIERGRTLKIEIAYFEENNIEGKFGDKNVKFFEESHAPNWDEPITRAEFLKLLFDNHNFGAITLKPMNFADMSDENPFKEYIQKAYSLGIISGYEDGNFGPYDPITRAHIAKILVEAFEPSGIDEASEFEDVTFNDWHYDYIKRAVKARYFQGYPDGLMRPDRNINFDEAETVIKRATVPREFASIKSRNYYVGYIGIHRMEVPGTKILKIITDSNHDYPVEILNRTYPTKSFYLEPSKNELFASDKIDNTWNLINGAKANPTLKQLWQGKFIVPTDGILTLGFGDTLYINGKFSGSHFGLDYANAEGTKVYATNDGIVTLAENTMSYGNTVVIDHGQNVFSMYLHNHELKVQKGDSVKKGDLIATMGMTGIATGPHLHFTIFIGDVIVDNYEWYDGKF